MLLSGSSHHISDNNAFIFSSLTLTQEYKFNIFTYLPYLTFYPEFGHIAQQATYS